MQLHGCYTTVMPRQARIILPNCPHHVTQRGNQRRSIFVEETDYQAYLSLLGDTARRYGVRLRGYCLMTNHVHLVPIPASEDGLARVVGLVHQRYSQLLNWRTGGSGHCWQNRFFSCPLDESYFTRVLRYVERNPARAMMVDDPWDYPWSSARAHCTGEDPTGLLDMTDWGTSWPGDYWRDYLKLPEQAGEVETLRLSTTIGRPLGPPDFIARLEMETGRHLTAGVVGRPRKVEMNKVDKSNMEKYGIIK